MDAFVTDAPNGATWIRDCLLNSAEMVSACRRLDENSPRGIRHFSSIGKAVPLEQVESVEIELSRIEKEQDK
jgi:hypothetical protein